MMSVLRRKTIVRTIAVFALAMIVMWVVVVVGFFRGASNPALRAKFDSVKAGMLNDKVVGILGPPTVPPAGANSQGIWVIEDVHIWVFFDKSGSAYRASYDDKPQKRALTSWFGRTFRFFW